VIGGLLAGTLMKPVHRARTSLQVESFNEQALRDINPVSPLPNATAEDYLQNEVKLLESETLARRVANQLGPASEETPGRLHSLLRPAARWLASVLPLPPPDPRSPSEERLRQVQNALTVRTSLQSQVIEVFFDAGDPLLAARGANAAASEFIAMHQEAREQLVKATTEWLDKQAAELKQKLENANKQLQAFTARSGLVTAGNPPEQERLRQIQDALTKAEADRASKQARYAAASASQADTLSDAATSAALRQYQTDLATMRRQLADLRTIYTAGSDRVTRLAAQIAETEGAIIAERGSLLARLRDEYSAAASLERTLSDSLARQMTTVQAQTEKGLEYNVLKNEVDTAQKLYDSVLERAKAAGAASALRVTNVRIIDPATPPREPYSPNLPLNMAVGFGLGTLGSVGLVLLQARSSKVRRPGELISVAVPELGVVPSAARNPSLAVVRRDLYEPPREHFDSLLLRESFRAVLMSLLVHAGQNGSGRGSGSNAVVVGSLGVMEGKTTIVANLGIASAQHRREVLLIDADLHRPRLHQRFGLPNEAGLVELLRDPELLNGRLPESVLQRTQVDCLSVLTSGQADDAASNLLYSPALPVVLRKLSQRFELILIDTAPLSLYSEARMLGRLTDGLVLVVRANTKSRDELQMAYQKLIQDRVRVLGAILNDWKIDRRQARAYARYHSYYQRP
jgi:capsular exopolysaccharide synthesis family protein